MQRACDSCGEEYEARRPSSRFCSTRCRVRAQRGAVQRPPEPIAEPRQATSGVTGATWAALEAAGRVDTPLGQAAMVLAARVDAGVDTGSGLASLARELRATLDAATRGAQAAVDPLDELRARRDGKSRAAAG